MEELKLKYETTKKALDTLKEAIKSLDILQKNKALTKELEINLVQLCKDSIIQRFEYSFELIWKYLKHYLEKEIGVKLEQSGPRPIYRHALKARLITAEESEKALKMIDDRNLTTHTYKEATANKVVELAKEYYSLLELILSKTKV